MHKFDYTDRRDESMSACAFGHGPGPILVPAALPARAAWRVDILSERPDLPGTPRAHYGYCSRRGRRPTGRQPTEMRPAPPDFIGAQAFPGTLPGPLQ